MRDGLRNLTVLADATELTRDELDHVLLALSPGDQLGQAEQDDTAPEDSGAASSTLWDLALQAGSAERYLLRTLPASA